MAARVAFILSSFGIFGLLPALTLCRLKTLDLEKRCPLHVQQQLRATSLRQQRSSAISITMKTCINLFFFFLLASVGRAQWSTIDSGTTNNLRGVYLLNSGVGFAVGDAGTILKTTDAGTSWDLLLSGTTKALYDVYAFNDSESVAVGDGGLILRTVDGGVTWQTVASGVKDSLRSVSFSGANGICGGLSQDILYSTDSGATWHVSQKGFFGGGFFGAHMLSPTLGIVTGQNSIFQGFQGTTVDGGVNWTFTLFISAETKAAVTMSFSSIALPE